MIEKLIKNLSKKPLVHQLSCDRFIVLNQFVSLNIKPESPIYMLYKIKHPYKGTSINLDKNFKTVSFSNLYHLYTLSLNFGYLFEFPVIPYRTNLNYFSIYKENSDINNVEALLKTQHISIYGEAFNSMLIVSNKQSFIDLKR